MCMSMSCRLLNQFLCYRIIESPFTFQISIANPQRYLSNMNCYSNDLSGSVLKTWMYLTRSLTKGPQNNIKSGGQILMMASSNGNTSRVTGPLCGEFTGHRWITLIKTSDAELWYFLWFTPWINGWVTHREAGDLRHHRTLNDVIVMY